LIMTSTSFAQPLTNGGFHGHLLHYQG
jgi:hypothetical protein